MTVTASSHRRLGFGFSVILLGLCSACLILGCKSKQSPPNPANPPATAVPSQPPAREPVTTPPAVKKHLYSADADPRAEIAAALKQARREHKRVILDFGGDWCGDCQVLDIYLHQSPNQELLDKNFLLVHIDIGHFDKNIDVTDTYKVPIHQGVPALAVLDAGGKLLYSQKTGEFQDMRYMHSASVTDFLNRWKA